MIPRARELRIVYSRGSHPAALPQLSKPADAATLLMEQLGRESVEVCQVLLLNTKHYLMATHELSRGTLDSCSVHPRELFKVAILGNAAAVIVAHNHPSGDPTPSADDVALCCRLQQASNLIGIELIDFLIIGDGRYYSFKEAGR